VVSEPDWRGREVVFRLSKVLGATDRVLVVDDWVETGNQALALRRAAESCGSTFVGCSVIVDGTTESVRKRLGLHGLVRSADLPPN
jgi:adenine phosphoribosyltransferase